LLLKRATGKPWVAELRDGWYRWNRAIFPDYPRWRDALEHTLEAAALRSADRVVLVTERMAEAFRQQCPDLPREHFRVVSNGYDPAQYETLPAPDHHAGWRLVHTGALYYGRSVTALLEAAQRVMDAEPAFRRDFTLRLIGTLDGSARAEVQRSSVRVELVPQAAHAEVIREMRAADALLLVANTTPGAEATVPGKLFEYLAVGRPVLAIAPCASSTADVLKLTGGGWLAAADDVSDIARTLHRAYADRSVPTNAAGVARFDRRRLAGELAAILDEVACRRV
jgi:glycosyltransferase involved in cell wall biosynthesis